MTTSFYAGRGRGRRHGFLPFLRVIQAFAQAGERVNSSSGWNGLKTRSQRVFYDSFKTLGGIREEARTQTMCELCLASDGASKQSDGRQLQHFEPVGPSEPTLRVMPLRGLAEVRISKTSRD